MRTTVLCALVSVLGLPLLALAQDFSWLSDGSPGTGIIGELADLAAITVPVLMGVALVVFLWGLAVFIFKAGDDQSRAQGRNRMIWGIVALFVIAAVWGIVTILIELTGVQPGASSSLQPPTVDTRNPGFNADYVP
jgi:hypothetical protein